MSSHHFSIEFFPPKTPEAFERLRETRARLYRLSPEYFSVTLGAGGTTREGTQDVAVEIHQEGRQSAPHITCIGTSRATIRERIMAYKSLGIKRLVALRGDLPSSYGVLGEFRYANELVEFVRAETGDWFSIDVAAYPEMHPQAKSPQDDLENFVRKVKAGADAAITQYFYNPDAYFRFVEAVRKAGVETPIIAGVMPITNYASLARFSDACGAEIPRWMRLRLESYGEDLASIREFGLDVVTALCERLLEGGAPGFHFYSLNQAAPVEALYERLGPAGYRPDSG
ncbi:MAG: methylenetetrahydrofolate reductase [NAD(P)H] [Burkholderiaceae bacterium]|jgi:methylenetetrahydrofolate reductase (NADPH)|nr:methylenetetrahydrofolate reductase [NAD(P)H] [Burkholderiaceae bacterium]